MLAMGQSNKDALLTIEKMQLEYFAPLETQPNFIGSGKAGYYEYEFGLELDNGNTLILVQTKEDDGSYVPQVAITGLISTLATNDQTEGISMLPVDQPYLDATNCDWAIEVLFTPKKEMGNYRIAHMKSIYKANIGVVNILYFSKEDVRNVPILRFKD